jgi:hypothetical protein
MMLRLTQLHLAVVAAAIAAVSLSVASARAFTMENLSANPGGNSRFSDPDDQVQSPGRGMQPFGPGGPTVQFGGGQGAAPLGHYPGAGFAAPSSPPPDPYARPLGNGD